MLPFARMLEFGNEIPAPVLPLIGKIETVTGITVPDSSMQHAVYDSVHNRMYTSGDNLIRYYDFSTNTWTTMGNRQGGSSGYNARRGAGLVIAGERVYVFGGGSAGTYGDTQLASYIDTTTNTWTRIADMPISTTNFRAVYDGLGSIFVLINRSMYKYSITDNTYTKLTDSPIGQISYNNGTGRIGMTIIGQNIYLAYNGKLVKYSILDDSYIELTDTPIVSSYVGLVSDSNMSLIYTAGNVSAGCWQYIISSNTWKVISTVYPVVGANQTLALVGTGLDDLNRYMWCSTSTNLYKIT